MSLIPSVQWMRRRIGHRFYKVNSSFADVRGFEIRDLHRQIAHGSAKEGQLERSSRMSAFVHIQHFECDICLDGAPLVELRTLVYDATFEHEFGGAHEFIEGYLQHRRCQRRKGY